MNDGDNLSNCSYSTSDFLNIKLWLVGVLGTVISLLGIALNAFLLSILMRGKMRHSYLMYLLVLAIMDMGILGSYIAVFSVQIYYDHFGWLWMYVAWVHYIPYLFFLSKAVLLAQTYLIVAVTAERFVEVTRIHGHRRTAVSHRERWCVIAAVILFAVAFRVPVLWELSTQHNKNCTGFSEWSTAQTELATRDIYRRGYNIWADNLVRVFVPFCTLLTLNLLIITRWKKTLAPPSTTKALLKHSLLPAEQVLVNNNAFLDFTAERKESMCRGGTVRETSEQDAIDREARRQGLKAATKMMIAIVSSYLICNLLNFVITLWEHIDRTYLQVEQHQFYTLTVDIISLLVIINSTVRLPIYYVCNPIIRFEVAKTLELWRRGVFVWGESQPEADTSLCQFSINGQTPVLEDNAGFRDTTVCSDLITVDEEDVGL